MYKKNCWEFKQCGREPGGKKEAELGVCIASTEARANGMNSGKNGGRACWVVSGTLCGGKVQGTFAAKMSNCLQCEFYRHVREEEGDNMCSAQDMIEQIKRTN
jgi:hypothetical protein